MTRSFEVEVVPGELWVAVTAHDHDTPRGPVACTTCVTRGLATHSQKELVLTLRRAADAPPTVHPALLQLLASVREHAAAGRLVDAGDLSEFSLPGDHGLGDLRGCGYLPAGRLAGAALPADALAVVLLFGEEAAVWRSFGPGRVKALLGERAGYWPCPPWSEPGRAPVTSLQQQATSILSETPRAYLPGVELRREAGRVRLRVPEDARARLAELLPKLPPTRAMALLVDIDPAADGCLYWHAGQAAPAAISAPGAAGERLAGAFVLFMPQQSADELRVHEDGFAALLQPETWARLRAALAAGEALTIGDGELVLDVGPYAPPRPPGVTALKHITLRTGETELAVRVGLDALSRYIRAIEAAAAAFVAADPPGAAHQLTLQVELGPARPAWLQLVAQPPQSPAREHALAAALARVEPPPVLGQVNFQLSLACRPG